MAFNFIRTVSSHFRILCLCVLFIAIATISLSSHDKDETLPFRTYSFSLDGTGSTGKVYILMNFGNSTYGVLTNISAGSYSLRTGTGSWAAVNDEPVCEITEPDKECVFEAKAPATLSVLFNKSEMLPSGRFRFSLPQKADITMKIVLGDRYMYKELFSVLPRDVHGHYSPEDGTVIIQTVSDHGTGEGPSDYLDFDLYSVDGVVHRTNEYNDWQEDMILAPLVMAFLVLLLSDVIDYAHRYLRERYLKENAKREGKR